MDLTFDNRMPLGDLMRDIESVLDATARSWMQKRGVDLPPASQPVRAAAWAVSPAVRTQLKNLHLTRFALAFAGQLEFHTADGLHWAREYGASYTELGSAIGMTRQGVQRKWGIRQEEKDAATKKIADAVDTLKPPFENLDTKWHATPIEHNYDPEAALSGALVSVENATASSPNQLLLFHYETFLGPATDQNLAFTRLLLPMCKLQMVAVEFKVSDASHGTQSEEALYTARFAWRNDELVWFGDLPPEVTSSIAHRGY